MLSIHASASILVLVRSAASAGTVRTGAPGAEAVTC
jgi:hypothetical protein